MADIDPTTPKTSAKGGWSDAERVALLVSFVESKGGPDWKTVTIPPGRTQKACQHVWSKMKEEAKKAGLPAGEAQAKSPGGAGENGTPKTPTSGKKRGAKGDANEGTPSKSAKKGKKGAQGEVAVKAEEGNEEAV